MKLWLSVRNWVIKPKHRTNQIGVQGTSSLVRPGETWSSPQARNSPFETQCPPWVSTKTNKKERPTDWLVFPENCATCGSRFFCSFLVDFRKSENQKGIPRSAERVSGLCPENPQPLKRLAKLSLRLRAGWVRPYFLILCGLPSSYNSCRIAANIFSAMAKYCLQACSSIATGKSVG